MSQVIAGIYEIEQQIGAGGGGIVYLGRHIRLNKQIVLKADKRKLSTNAETLRREVDMLKNLSHTYIPQVYDFVQEGEEVYTVMDYIDGESLDKLLARQHRVSQPQLIKWACQLLEALDYLHKQPPYGILHGDIKPANIMLRPNGDICLIDYNIALALGEDGAVKVGFSRGYASPEHYGADYIKGKKSAAVGNVSTGFNSTLPDESTELLDNTLKLNVGQAKNAFVYRAEHSNSTSNGSEKGILLDARSDIYSLGATLYHLISGNKPDHDARKVEPLGKDICSPSVSKILQKAMAPQPSDRYQSAEEMLLAFRNLYKTDNRVVRHKRRMIIAASVLSVLFICGGISTFIGLSQIKQRESALALAEYSANALADGDVSMAIDYALQAIPRGKSILNAPVTSQAQKALTDALGVYDLSDGFAILDALSIPSEPFHLEMSPDGTKIAVTYAYEVAIYDINSRKQIIALPIQESALSDAYFIDNTKIVYAGIQGIEVYDIDNMSSCWIGNEATIISISGDRSVIAAVNRDDSFAIIYRASDGSAIGQCDFGELSIPIVTNDIFADPEDEIFALNEDGSLLAVSFSDGSMTIFNLQNEDEIVVFDSSDYTHFDGGFWGENIFAYVCEDENENVFRLIDTNSMSYIADFTSQDSMILKVDENGIYLSNDNLLSKIDPVSLQEHELVYLQGESIIDFSVGKDFVLVSTDNQNISFYDNAAQCVKTIESDRISDFVKIADKLAVTANRNEPILRLMELNRNEASRLFAYDLSIDHDEARISADGKNVMLFDYRSFTIYDMDGNIVTQVELPDADNIYDQQFIRENGTSSLKVIWYDGTVKYYSASDGNIIKEDVIDKPDESLYEEFVTKDYKVTSSLHGTPEVYSSESGKLLGKLETEDYLTYVTQIQDGLITEYITTEGKRYGLLLNKQLATLAYLPDLCDVTDEMIIFDDHSGYLKQTCLYSLDDLIKCAETYISK